MITTKNLYKRLVSLSLGLALSATLLNCATPSRTNQNYNNIPSISKQSIKEEPSKRKKEDVEQQANTLFEKLLQKNSHLAEELGKIPEFLDGINEDEVKALEEIVSSYTSQGSKVEDAFKQILDEGKSEVRKYCTPLRFLFWVANEKKIDNLLKKYSLEKIFKLTKSKMSKVNDFKEATDMLNSPKLIDIYERSNFSYENYMGSKKTDEQVFKSKRANCKDTSEFTVYCLRKAGYDAGLLWVDSKSPEGHIITYFKDKGKIFIMDNGMVFPSGITGPYNSLSDIPYTIRREITCR